MMPEQFGGSSPTAPRKLGPGLVAAMAIGLLLAGLAMTVYNEHLANEQKLGALKMQAEILSASVAAALSFDDPVAVHEYVAALTANRDVDGVGVYDAQGRMVAGYVRGAPASDPGHMAVTAPVAQRHARLGSVYLRAIKEPIARRAARYGGIAMLVVMTSLVVGVLGVSNRSLTTAHRALMVEMEEREKAEEDLRRSREAETHARFILAGERARMALHQSEQQLELALQAGRLGSWVLDLQTGNLVGSEIFRANFGLGPGDPLDGVAAWVARLHDCDREQLQDALDLAIADRTDLEIEQRTLTPEGETHWILVRGRAFYDQNGAPMRMAGVSLDITARKLAEGRQRALLDELNHRVKNTLASVQSIAQQTLRNAKSMGSFESAFLARIDALAGAHDLLSEVAWEGASLTQVIGQNLAAYVDQGAAGRINYSGPALRLGPNAAVALTMAFHELATNAAKYGAFSCPTGRVGVTWSVDRSSQPFMVEIDWRETGGPKVVLPQRRGFGSRFIQIGLAREFDGEVQLEFPAEGVCCHMRLPISSKLQLTA